MTSPSPDLDKVFAALTRIYGDPARPPRVKVVTARNHRLTPLAKELVGAQDLSERVTRHACRVAIVPRENSRPAIDACRRTYVRSLHVDAESSSFY